jgi:hypothetical protein
MGPADWETWLATRLQRTVEVKYCRSRTMPLHVEDGDELLRVRMHRFFAQATDDVRESMAKWITVGKRAHKACAVLDAWIDARLEELPLPKITVRTRGVMHDLEELAEGLFGDEFALDFARRPRPAVSWGRRQKSSARRTLMLGSYNARSNLVRVHPVLDQPLVPDWYVRFILFHEILHAVIPSRHVHHTPAFRRRERSYRDFARARAWEKQHIERLIRHARRGSRSRQRFLF